MIKISDFGFRILDFGFSAIPAINYRENGDREKEK